MMNDDIGIELKIAPQIHTDDLWPESLKVLRTPIMDMGFSLPFPQVDSLFRMVTENQYGGMPIEIRKTEGGAEYTTSGWDFRVLSEGRYTLATRREPTTILPRDRVFERISNSIIRIALTQDLDFWRDHLPLSNFILSTDSTRVFTSNVVDILFLKFPESIPIILRKIWMERKKGNMEEIYKITSPLTEEKELKLEEKDEAFINWMIVINNFRITETHIKPYIKVFFGEACLKKAKQAFDRCNLDEARDYIYKFAYYGIACNNEKLSSSNKDEVSQYIQNCKCRLLGRCIWFFPEDLEKENVIEATKLIWEISRRVTTSEQ